MNKNTKISLSLLLVGLMLISSIIVYRNSNVEEIKRLYQGPLRPQDNETLFREQGIIQENFIIKNLETGETWNSVEEYRWRNS